MNTKLIKMAQYCAQNLTYQIFDFNRCCWFNNLNSKMHRDLVVAHMYIQFYVVEGCRKGRSITGAMSIQQGEDTTTCYHISICIATCYYVIAATNATRLPAHKPQATEPSPMFSQQSQFISSSSELLKPCSESPKFQSCYGALPTSWQAELLTQKVLFFSSI